MTLGKVPKVCLFAGGFLFALIQVPSHPYNGDMAVAYQGEFASLL